MEILDAEFTVGIPRVEFHSSQALLESLKKCPIQFLLRDETLS